MIINFRNPCNHSKGVELPLQPNDRRYGWSTRAESRWPGLGFFMVFRCGEFLILLEMIS